MHYIEDVKKLALILVYTLDLNVVEGVERNINACAFLDILL